MTIAAIIIAAVFASAVMSRIGLIQSSISNLIKESSDRLGTSVRIVHAEMVSNTSGTYALVFIKNVGAKPILAASINLTDVFIGSYGGELRYCSLTGDDVLDAGEWTYRELKEANGFWELGETLLVTINVTGWSLDPPYHVKVVLPSGLGDEAVFGG